MRVCFASLHYDTSVVSPDGERYLARVPFHRELPRAVAARGHEVSVVHLYPHDLSFSLGIPEQYEHPKFLNACETILRGARDAGVGAGIHFWGNTDQQIQFLKLGANLLIHSADITLFQKYLRYELETIKKGAGLYRAIDEFGPDITI